MWTTPIAESTDPMPQLAKTQSAQAQIVAGGEELLRSILAFAMTMQLPKAYATLKQSMYLLAPLTSKKVRSSVQAEWEC
jgi:hypothetical protein